MTNVKKDSFLVSVYKNNDRIYVFNTDFKKIILFFIFLVSIILFGVTFFFLYLFEQNRPNIFDSKELNYSLESVEVSHFQVLNIETGIRLDFKVDNEKISNFNAIVLGMNGHKFRANVPIFNLFDIYSKNLCTEGENIFVESTDMVYSVDLDFEGLEYFDRISLFLCDKDNRLQPFHKEVSISAWRNKNAIR